MKKIFLLLAISFVLSACGPTKTTSKVTPSPAPRVTDIAPENRPLISLTPRDDGHMLFLKISKIPNNITQIEYELLYTASDGTSEIEKGIGDTIKEITANLERKLLLGTESCTNGCKYKYDDGVNGGTLTINFINDQNQVATFTTPFNLSSTAILKKSGEIKLESENFSVAVKEKLSGSNFYILMKNYQSGYSIFSNSSGPLVGNYPQP